jgi:protein involved in polysaccharide export with SLBB domain
LVLEGAMSRHLRLFRKRAGFALFCIGLGCATTAWGQRQAQPIHNTAINQADSRAEREAEQMVSLSADKIIAILRMEPGLMLQLKKALVRRAFEQGRVLDANELTDDSLFALIHEDDAVRVIATQEIVDRSYIKAKPTREELARNLPCLLSSPVPATKTTAPSQEQVYWDEHDLDCSLLQHLPSGAAQPTYGQMQRTPVPNQQQNPSSQDSQQSYPQQLYPQMQSPQLPYQPPQTSPQVPSTDYRQQLDVTQAQPAQGYFGMDSDENQMASSQSDDFQSLSSVSQTSFSDARMRAMSGAAASDLAAPRTSNNSPSSMLQGKGSSTGYSREENFDRQMRSQLPPYFPSQSEQPRLHHRANPYADIPSLYDLYAQYSRRLPVLERFGEDVFRNGSGNLEGLPMDAPAGPNYVVGPGDGLTINLTGGVAQRLQRVVDREGRVALPEVGALQISGRNLGDVQHMVQTVLRTQFRDVEAEVSLSRIRTVRVYVVGDVERPGPYDLSALSTPLNAVYAAGGPTSSGSLRTVQHYRGKQLIQEVDLYDLLLHGIRNDLEGLQPGDAVRVPPLRDVVTIEGMVRRPAIYELSGEKNLAEVLELAGGVLPTGTLRHVDVERVENHESRTMLRLDIPETNGHAEVAEALENFKVQDGDKIRITPILPFADKTVYLDGYVSRPGKFAYREGMKVTDLIGSYKDLLPEPSIAHAEIIRLSQPDYTPTVLAFNLGDALAGKDQDLVLQPFDTVRIFSRYDFEDAPVITITGEVRDPGDHLTNGAPRLRDAVYLAGGTTRDVLLDDAQIFRKTSDGKLSVISVNLGKALAGDEKDNIVLAPKDRVFIHRDLNKVDPAKVTIEGEVGRAGNYPLGDGMTAAELVRLAGGFKRGAYTETADLTRYEVEQGSKVVSDHVGVPIAKAMAGEPDTDVRLRDGDVLTIRQISGWKDLGATIKVGGEVVHPGTYGIQEGEKLSSVIQRAGGFRSEAYPYGAIFQRSQIREMEELNRSDLIMRVQAEASDVKLLPGMDTDQLQTAKAAVLQYQSTIAKLESTPPSGRLVVHISSDVKRWANSSSDIFVRNNDEIYIPKKPNVVIVDGSVYNPTAITYKPGRNAGWYLSLAGGSTEMGNKKAVFVVRADGSVVGGSGGMFTGGVQNTQLRPGDMVVVPEKAYSINTKWKTTLEAAQLVYAVGVAISVGRTF